MLQYFNTTWREITAKMPELAEAGYESLWVPPPTKGSGGLSVGYDLWDRFDLGSKDQRGSVATRYGTAEELKILVETAHRFGIRVYFDNIMNHNAFDIPGFNASTPIDVYPGLFPEDFHLRQTSDGYYRKWDNTRDWNDAWQVMNLGLSDLIDIAQEPGQWNQNHGAYEGATSPKLKVVRNPNNPEYYCYKPTGSGQSHAAGDGTYVGFGVGNGITAADIAADPDFYEEWVEDYLHRSARWLMDETRADGLRLDAVKHVRDDFFGASGAGADSSDYGYTGQVQTQFNLSRGFSDWGNHRDSVFDDQAPRDDAMLFGEHLGEPPGYAGYVDRGMRLVDNDLRSKLNGNLGSPWAGLTGLDQPGSAGFSPSVAVMHAQSHDNDYAARRELQHAIYFTRAGIPLVYTDGNFQAETLSQSGGAFPRHANTAFLGQFGDARLPNMMYIHQHFARGYQVGRWSDDDFIAYERIDKRENPTMTDGDGATLLIALNDDYSSGQSRTFNTSFPAGAYLKQYSAGSTYSGYATVDGAGQINLLVGPGEYHIYSWANPDVAPAWGNAGGNGIQIYDGGAIAGTVTVIRKDGPDGDPGYNPHGLPDTDPTDFSYEIEIPRVTNGSNIRFVARADGSAENVLFRLDGGIDLNGATHSGGDPRDNPPALSTDVFLGYEQGTFVTRNHAEKFAAQTTSRSTFGSAGAESFQTVVGSGAFTIVNGSGTNPSYGDTASFFYHDPNAAVTGGPVTQQFTSGATVDVWAKSNGVGAGYQTFLYYTTDGSFPEGASGEGLGSTQVVELFYQHSDAGDDWWKASISPAPSGTLTYKIGIVRTATTGGLPNASVFPSNAADVARKLDMTTVFEIDGFDATTATVRPHNDYNDTQVGLSEGMHVIRARAFLKRANRASIYNTYTQTFYYDAVAPQGEIVFPNEWDTLTQQSYGAVVRTDPSVTGVCFQIIDTDGSNDDDQTGVLNGNGNGFEPFVDANSDGVWNVGEAFTDLNGNSLWDTGIVSWVHATEVPASPGISPSNPDYVKEWRFDYRNIPSSGTAQILVRLKELSSSDDNSLTDAAGNFTTLTRNVNTAGPNLQIYVAYPQADGDVVNPGYVLKARITDLPGFSYNPSDFIVRIGSTSSGTSAGAVVVDPATYSVNYNTPTGFHELAVPLPNLFNGDPNFLHHVEVEYVPSSISATRLVKAAAITTPWLAITSPPSFDSNGQPYVIQKADIAPPPATETSSVIEVETDTGTTNVVLSFTYAENGVGTGVTTLIGGVPTTVGSKNVWTFDWTSIPHPRDVVPDPNHPGADLHYTVKAEGFDAGGVLVSTEYRNIHINFSQIVPSNPNDLDDDDDGILDVDELTTVDLPASNPETWVNGDVHVWNAYGNTSPVTPDSDNDGLHDALEIGWRGVSATDESYTDTNSDGFFTWTDSNGNGQHDVGEASEPFTDSNGDGVFRYATNPAADTNGDGDLNFMGDFDPPFFNTVPDNNGLPNYDFNRGRTEQIHGTVTNPNNPDTDGDGILDGVEDANKNGHVDGDGSALALAASPYSRASWPNGEMDLGETWVETDPNNADTDGDQLSDGHREDINYNGFIDGDTNGDRVYQSGEAWTETDPLNVDTDGDGLLDGWEVQYGLNPLDDGTDDLSTPTPGDGNVDNGASGDPDGDGFANTTEQSSSTHPNIPDSGTPPPAATIVIGPGATSTTVGAVTNDNEFTDWTCEDLVAFDEYEGAGNNNQSGDIFPAGDGFDSSRDIVAFYARDGGADGRYYFRCDMYDLRAFAEDSGLDIYVVIDTGNTGVGEFALPDEIDIGTSMRWEAVVACYTRNVGRVYVDTNPATNSTATNENLFGANGVVGRDQNTADGFLESYYNSDLDAVEFSISRQALIDAGWNGSATLNFQVYTTKDGTDNSGSGAGDLGGRNDIRDTIYDDWLAEDYWSQQSYISSNGELGSWMSGHPDKCKAAKVMMLVHGNRSVLPGNETHQLINSGYGSGYHRAVDAHEAFAEPMSLHVTPTLASSIQWAAVDPAAAKPWLDGPTLNSRIGSLASAGVVELLGSTFSDHAIAYFDGAYNGDNVGLANDVLTGIYGSAPSSQVFWNPERIADDAVLGQINAMGFGFTFVDQMRHLWDWFGRNDALSDNGYRLNEIHGVRCFVINDQASSYRFDNADNGLNFPLRNLYHRKATSGVQDQVITIFHQWSDFEDPVKADAYDRNLRWLANRPWVQIVTPEQIANNQIDINADGIGDSWYAIPRGSPVPLAKVSNEWLHHATQEDYDNWYDGQAGREEGLLNRVFDIRPGVPTPTAFGKQSVSSGVVGVSWGATQGLAPASQVGLLARSALHASTFQTAFHDQVNNDISRYSTGTYIWPDVSYQPMAAFSSEAQAQTRFASMYQAVGAWTAAPPASPSATSADIDQDGELEYILMSDSIYAVVEAIGGRVTNAWARDPLSGVLHQLVGNPIGDAGSVTEEEGNTHHTAGEVNAHRTSAFKDWFAAGPNSNLYVNDVYSVSPASGGSPGFTFTSSDGAISKTLSVDPSGTAVKADYTVGGGISTLYVRFGLSPNLMDLLVNGQSNLVGALDDGAVVHVENVANGGSVVASVDYAAGGANYNAAAIDEDPGNFDIDTLNMRNQAQTEQVEVFGSGSFTLCLGLTVDGTDLDGDGLPDAWENANGISSSDDGTPPGNVDNGPTGDPDSDGLTNMEEYLWNTDPQVYTPDRCFLHLSQLASGDSQLEFPAYPDRFYRLYYSTMLTPGTWTQIGGVITVPSPNLNYQVIDPLPIGPRRFYRYEVGTQ